MASHDSDFVALVRGTCNSSCIGTHITMTQRLGAALMAAPTAEHCRAVAAAVPELVACLMREDVHEVTTAQKFFAVSLLRDLAALGGRHACAALVRWGAAPAAVRLLQRRPHYAKLTDLLSQAAADLLSNMQAYGAAADAAKAAAAAAAACAPERRGQPGRGRPRHERSDQQARVSRGRPAGGFHSAACWGPRRDMHAPRRRDSRARIQPARQPL